MISDCSRRNIGKRCTGSLTKKANLCNGGRPAGLIPHPDRSFSTKNSFTTYLSTMKSVCLALLMTTGVGGFFSVGLANSLPTWHIAAPHRCAMIVAPPSEHPVIVRVTDAHQQVFLLLTLDAQNGLEEKIDFSAMPVGRYSLEVHYNQQPFYKIVHVHSNQVTDQDASIEFRVAQHYQF